MTDLMTAPTIDRPTTRRRVVSLVLPALLAVAAGTAVALDLPAWIRALVSAAAAITVAGRLTTVRTHGVVDAVLVVTGGAVVAVGLLGLVLDVVPGGITRLSWGIGLAVVELVALVLVTWLSPGRAGARTTELGWRTPVQVAGWAVAVLGVLAGALLLSIGSFHATHVDPLAMSLIGVDDGTATVSISSGQAAGPFELDLVTTSGRKILSHNIVVAAGQTVSARVALPTQARGLLQLLAAGQAGPLRELILDPQQTGATR